MKYKILNKCRLLTKLINYELNTSQKYFAFLCISIFFGIGFIVYTYYPGYMDPDNNYHLSSARAGTIINSIQPPVYVWLWGITDKVIPGPLGILFFHQILFWTGCSLFVLNCSRKLFTCTILLLVIACWPPLLAWQGTVVKDNSAVAALMFSVGNILWYLRSRKKVPICVALISLIYLCAIRHNSILIIIPLSCWIGFISLAKHSVKLRLCWGLTISICIFSIANYANQYLLNKHDAPNSYAFQQILVLDLAALSVATNEMLIPSPNARGNSKGALSLHDIKEIYNPFNVVTLYWSKDKGLKFRHGDSEYVDLLVKQWATSVLHNPVIYLKHRIKLTANLFGFGAHTCGAGAKMWKNHWNYRARETRWSNKINAFFNNNLDWIFNRGWLYVAICLLSLFTSFRLMKKNKQPAPQFWLALSGLLYALPYFIITPVCFFRLLLPLILLGVLCLCLLILEYGDNSVASTDVL